MAQPAAADPVFILKTVVGKVAGNGSVFRAQLAAERIGIAAERDLTVLLENAVPVHHTGPGLGAEIFIYTGGGDAFHFRRVPIPIVHFAHQLYFHSVRSPHTKHPSGGIVACFGVCTKVVIGGKAGTIKIIRKQLFVTHFLCFLPEMTSDNSSEVSNSYFRFYRRTGKMSSNCFVKLLFYA